MPVTVSVVPEASCNCNTRHRRPPSEANEAPRSSAGCPLPAPTPSMFSRRLIKLFMSSMLQQNCRDQWGVSGGPQAPISVVRHLGLNPRAVPAQTLARRLITMRLPIRCTSPAEKAACP